MLTACIPHSSERLLTQWGRSSTSSLPDLINTSRSALRVCFGQRTFDAEGLETAGRYFSRQISFPGGAGSGVTVGRGYDMGRRNASTIRRELTLAGVSETDAGTFSRAAGLRGAAAERFVRQNRESFPILTLEAQRKLFEDVVTPDLIQDIRKIFDKPDTVRAYGRVDWGELSQGAQELVFDLRYRGDYTPTTRKKIQPLLVNHDYKGLQEVMNDTAYWSALGVPAGRIKERQEMAQELL